VQDQLEAGGWHYDTYLWFKFCWTTEEKQWGLCRWLFPW